MAGGGIKVNNNSIRGGADGATFIPHIDGNGNLYWTNDKGYPNPPTVNIRYVLTEADKQEIKNAVLAELR